MPNEEKPAISRMRRFMRATVVTASTLTLLVAGVASSGSAHPPTVDSHAAVAGTAGFNRSFVDGRVAVDGGTIHYVRGGSGPAIVLLHGWPETWWAWHKVMPELAVNHTVIAIDLPGLGESSVPASGYDKATTAKRVRQAVNKLGFRQVTIMAHDVGVLVAYPYARDFPTEVTKLVVLESPLSGFGLESVYGVSFHFQFNMAPAPIPEQMVDNDDVKVYLGMIFDFSLDHSTVDRDVYYRAYGDPAHRHAGYEYYRAYPADALDNQANAAAKQLPMPVLAMGAALVFGPGVAASFRQVATNVHEVVAPDTLHFIPEENPRFLLDCVNLFLGDTAPSSGASPALANCPA